MDESTIDCFVKEFNSIKNSLLDRKLSEVEASVLAARLMDLPKSISPSLFYQIKQREDFKEYKFIGTQIEIEKISRINNGKSLKLDFNYKRGFKPTPITLKEDKALLMLSMIIAKFSNLPADAIGGISLENLEHIAIRISNKMQLEKFMQFEHDLPGKLARDLSRKNLGSAIEHSNIRGEDIMRFSFPPNRIAFKSNALVDTFNDISEDSLIRYEKEYSLNLDD